MDRSGEERISDYIFLVSNKILVHLDMESTRFITPNPEGEIEKRIIEFIQKFQKKEIKNLKYVLLFQATTVLISKK